jgi:N-acyl-D-amino-acid deacylase
MVRYISATPNGGIEMAKYDLLLRGGTIVDGTGKDRFVADVAIKNGLIAKIGEIAPESAVESIDVRGQIVAPGIIDVHTHYDVQLHWDPYLTPSGWHGTTTALLGNCGHGLAPCKPEMRERYMRMLENTEQIQYEPMRKALSWNWESFPEFLAHLKAQPKGVNIASLVPLNPLLSYVIGPDEAKTRPATTAERQRMRELLNEAMDAGASGFGFSYLGAKGNSHVDYDGTAMPCDVMAEEEAYNLCDVLRERGEGLIQVLCELPGGIVRRDLAEELARRSTRPVLHTVMMSVEGSPEIHRGIMRWLDDAASRGLSVYSHAMTARHWQEFVAIDYNVWDVYPEFRELSSARTVAEKLAIIRDPARRARIRNSYNAQDMAGQTGLDLERLILIDAKAAPTFARYKDYQLKDISADLKRPITDTLFDILIETEMLAQFCFEDSGGCNADYATEMLSSKRTLPGVSDGGAHNKFFSGGHWSTDMIIWLVREEKKFTLEQMHQLLNGRTVEVFGLKNRGLLVEGQAADIIVYDYDNLSFQRKRYVVLKDLPEGGWRRATQVEGMRYVVVNGEVTFVDGKCTGATPGAVVSNTGREATLSSAAA